MRYSDSSLKNLTVPEVGTTKCGLWLSLALVRS